MFFWLLKLYVRFSLQIFCKKIIISKPAYLQAKGPLLFAANHPNSFLDGIILTTLLREPVYSLARGDAFKNKKIEKLLRGMHLLPVYRTSEGVENLSHNYTTFAACQQVFANNGVVLIFSEGRCKNEWQLRPLKKGTARLAISTWQKSIPLTVVPLGFNYSSFRTFGNVVHLNIGEAILKETILQQSAEGKQLLAFNNALEAQLQKLVYHIVPNHKEKRKQIFYPEKETGKKILLALPAFAGLIVHAPFYFSIKKIVDKTFDNDHYDSVVATLLMLGYPFYWLLLTLAAGLFAGWMVALSVFILLPFAAWAFVQVK